VGTAGLVLLDLALLLAVARALGGLLERLRQPRVLGEVLAGLVLGASLLGALPGDPSGQLFTSEALGVLRRLGEIAVVAYLFVVGAELDARALRREGAAVALVGTRRSPCRGSPAPRWRGRSTTTSPATPRSWRSCSSSGRRSR
jgi:Kef-type K+ transport system membrane component KefB